MKLTEKHFGREMFEAAQRYEMHVVCLEKSTDDFRGVLESLIQRAIAAYESRGSGLRHGIALDNHVTVILSQTDDDVPHCGIYFNLHTPYK